MAFAYMIGVFLFGILCLFGMKLCRFFAPYPPFVPHDKECDKFDVCNIRIDGKSYQCLKTVHVLKTYGYNSDCDVIEWECRYLKYDLQNPITEMPNFIDVDCRTFVLTDKGNETECYMADNFKAFIAVDPIKNERIYEYRKPKILRKFSSKRKPAES